MVPEIDLWRAASTAVEPILPGRGVAAGGGPHGIVKGCVEVAAPSVSSTGLERTETAFSHRRHRQRRER